MHVFADPTDVDTVWVADYSLWKSIDGGKTFVEVATPHGDNHDLWIDPSNSRRMIEGNDGGACVTLQRRRDVVEHLQPADRAVLPRVRGRPAAVPDLWLAAGQLGDQPAEPVPPRGDHRDRLGSAGRRRERLHRGQAGRPCHRRRWLRRQRTRHGPAHPLRSPDGAGAHRQRLARSVWHGDAARRASLSLPVDVPGVLLALGPSRAVDRRQPRLPLGRRGAELGDREPRSHAKRSGEARPVGRADHPGQYRRRGVLRDLRAGRVAARARRALGGDRRRPRPPLARSRPDVAAGDAAGPPRMGARERDRAVPARRGHVLRRGDALQAGRHAPLSLQDERLWPHVDAHHGEPAGGRDHARRARGPEPARTALLRHRDRRVGLARRRRRMAAAPRESAGGADPRSHRQGHRPGRGHARAVVLDPRRPLTAPPDGRCHRLRRRAPVRAAPGGAVARIPRPRHEVRAEPRGRVSARGLDGLCLSPDRVPDR